MRLFEFSISTTQLKNMKHRFMFTDTDCCRLSQGDVQAVSCE